MSDFIKRNMPVFIIGGFTVALFLIIIAISEQGDRGSVLPDLVKLKPEERQALEAPEDTPNNQNQIIVEDTNKEVTPGNYSNGDFLEITDEDKAMLERSAEFLERLRLSSEEVEAEHGIIEIVYTDQGFIPRNATGYKFQRVLWTNTTNKAINIKPNLPKYDDWSDNVPKKIEPGATLEYIIPETGTWSYREIETQEYGSIFAKEATR